MKNSLKSWFIVLMASTVMLCLFGCKEKEDRLVMGCSADYPPFEYKKKGEIIGVDVDIAKRICEKLGYALEVKDIDFAGLIASLNSGRLDFVMTGMTVTEKRQKQVDFSKIYYEPEFAIIYRNDNAINSTEELDNKQVGVQLGSTMELFLKEQVVNGLNIKISTLNRNLELIQELKNGRVDGIMLEKSQVIEFVKANPDLGYKVFEKSAGAGYAIAFPKGSELKDKFDTVLEEMKANGELEAILAEWSL